MKTAFEQNVLQHFAFPRHPNRYSWGRHAAEDDASSSHPHTSVPEGRNEQVVPRGTRSKHYRDLAQPYGTFGKPTSLVHYDYRPHEQAIDNLIRDRGYEVYYGGGAYGRPDLENRNYSTGHLMVYDPSPGQGGDFDDEALTRSWRKLHELSHAETYPTLNEKYGEGRRLGRLGYQRTLREAKRAVEWEALALLRQRELSEKVGHPIDDATFAREWNTVLSDAVHRAITGRFTNPEEEGFAPSTTPVPLEAALAQLEAHAQKLGLKGEDDLLTSRTGARDAVDGGLTRQAWWADEEDRDRAGEDRDGLHRSDDGRSSAPRLLGADVRARSREAREAREGDLRGRGGPAPGLVRRLRARDRELTAPPATAVFLHLAGRSHFKNITITEWQRALTEAGFVHDGDHGDHEIWRNYSNGKVTSIDGDHAPLVDVNLFVKDIPRQTGLTHAQILTLLGRPVPASLRDPENEEANARALVLTMAGEEFAVEGARGYKLGPTKHDVAERAPDGTFVLSDAFFDLAPEARARALDRAQRVITAAASSFDYARTLDAFTAAVAATKDEPTSNMKAWSQRRMAAWDFLREGKAWALHVLQTKAIPPKKHKAVEVAVRVLNRRELPKDEANWFVQNQHRFELLRDAANWPERSAGQDGDDEESASRSDDLFSLGGFQVHNTIGATGKKLEDAKTIVSTAASASHNAELLPDFASMFYGPLYLVGQIERPNWAAWYKPGEDAVYLRPGVRGLPIETSVQHLLHELAHRYWRRRLGDDAKIAFALHHDQTARAPMSASFPPVGTVLEGLKVNRKTPKVTAYEGGHATLVDAKTDAPIGRVDLLKFLGWVGEVNKQRSFPTPYAQSSAEEHFCESAALALQGRLPESHLTALREAVASARTAAKKTLERLLAKAPEDEALIRQLADGDPTSNHDWLDRMYAWAKGGAAPSEIIEVAHDVDRYSRALKEKGQPANPYGYPTAAAAKEAIQALRAAKVTPKLRKRDAKYSIVYQGDGMTIYKVDNKEAACTLGSDSDWCSSKWTGDWYERRLTMYGPLMYIARFDDGRAYMLRVRDGKVITAFDKRDNDMMGYNDSGFLAVVKQLSALGIAKYESGDSDIGRIMHVLRTHGDWATGGKARTVAKEWLDAGFRAGEVDSWLDAGIYEATMARDLVEGGVTPNDVNNIHAEARGTVGDYPADAIIYAVRGMLCYVAVPSDASPSASNVIAVGRGFAEGREKAEATRFVSDLRDSDHYERYNEVDIYLARRIVPLDEKRADYTDDSVEDTHVQIDRAADIFDTIKLHHDREVTHEWIRSSTPHKAEYRNAARVSVETLKRRHPDVDVDGLRKLDPTPQGDYVEWLVRQHVTPGDSTVAQALHDFVELKKKRVIVGADADINRLDVEGLKRAVSAGKDALEEREITSLAAERAKLIKRNIERATPSPKPESEQTQRESANTLVHGDYTFTRLADQEAIADVSPGNWCVGWLDRPSHYEAYSSESGATFYLVEGPSAGEGPWLLFLSGGPHNGELKNQYDEESKTQAVVDAVTETFGVTPSSAADEDIAELLRETTDRRLLLEHASSHSPIVLAAIATNPRTPASVLSALIPHSDPTVRQNIAANPSAPVEMLDRLSHDKNAGVRSSVAANPNTPAEALDRLSYDQGLEVRLYVAANPSAPVEMLDRLSHDQDPYVRQYIAANPSAPVEMLDRLSYDQDPYARQNIAANPSTPVEALDRLSHDKNETVRSSVAENPNTPAEALDRLSYDQDLDVRLSVAVNRSAPAEALDRLSYDKNKGVRRYVAKNPNTPAEALDRLSHDQDPYVRQNVAENPNTPAEALERLRHDQDEIVRQNVRRRTAEKVTREQYREVTHEAVSAKLLGDFEGRDVYRVDGTWVRDKLDVDFVSGGHFARYTYVPEGEVWVEDGADKDVAAAIVHELVECAAMCDGASYDAAHALAAEVESVFRLHYDGEPPFKAASAFLEAPTNLEAMERVAAVDVVTFDQLRVGERFYLVDAPKKEALIKLDVVSYQTPDGERVETVPKRLVMVWRADKARVAQLALPEVRGTPEFIEFITPYLRVLPLRQARTAAERDEDVGEVGEEESTPPTPSTKVKPKPPGIVWPPPPVGALTHYPGKTFGPSEAWHLRELPSGEIFDAWRGKVVPPDMVEEARANPPEVSTTRPAEREKLKKKKLRETSVLDPEQEERLRALNRKRETARPRPPPLTSDDVTLQALGVRPNGGVDNILAVLRHATPSIVRQQRNWYPQAKKDVRAVATKYDVAPSVVSAVTAIVSPNLQWVDNVYAAEQMLLGKGREVIEYRNYIDEEAIRNWMLRIYPDLFVEKKTLGVRVYLPNILKAQRVLDAYGASGKESWTIDVAEPIKLSWNRDAKKSLSVAEARRIYNQKVARGWTARLTKRTVKKGDTEPTPSWNQGEVLPLNAPFPVDAVDARLVLNPPFKAAQTPKSGPNKGKTRNAPKVTAFFQSMMDPNAHGQTVVLDGHAINMWRGNIESLSDIKAPTANQKDAMIADYREAATRAKSVFEGMGIKGDLTPQQLQAVTWVVWREAVRRKDPNAEASGDADVGSVEEEETAETTETAETEVAESEPELEVERQARFLEVVAADKQTQTQTQTVMRVLEGPSKSYERDIAWAPALERALYDTSTDEADWPVAEMEFVPDYERDPEIEHIFEGDEWPDRDTYESDFGLSLQSPNKLDLKGDTGAENIRRVLRAATDEERRIYADWYLVAHNQAKMIHTEVNRVRAARGESPLSFATVCAVIATLSPGTKWEVNLRGARRILLGRSVSGTGGFYPVNVYKAIRTVADDDPDRALTGDTRKVRPFYETLLSPKEAAKKAVVDRHMYAIWFGDADDRNPSQRVHEKVQADVAKVAEEEGLSTQAVQAITWYLWRNRAEAERPSPTEETKARERESVGDLPARDFARWKAPSMRIEEFASKQGRGGIRRLLEVTAAIGVTAAEIRAKRRRKKDKSDRFVGETYWLPKDSTFARTRSKDAGTDATEIRLDPGARVLREGERDFIALGREPSIDDVMKAAFEKGYDAVRVKDRLAILNENAVAERTSPRARPGWLG